MNEQILRFGEREHLIGILTLPSQPLPRALPVLIPNTGVEHRVGPNRLHVHLCRAIADAGFPALRLDLSGMGDSHMPRGSVSDATRDLQAAMHHLEQLHLGSRFVLVGLCSGASDVHALARVDARVAGAAFIDGFAFATPRYYLTYIAQRLLDPARIWYNLARRALPAQERAKTQIAAGDIEYLLAPSRIEMRRDLLQFMHRQLALCYFYTGQVQEVYNYASQLTDAFPELRHYRGFELHYLTQADHTFSRASMRVLLAELLIHWLRDKLVQQGAPAPGPAAAAPVSAPAPAPAPMPDALTI